MIEAVFRVAELSHIWAMMEPLLGLIEQHLMSKNIVIGFGDNSA